MVSASLNPHACRMSSFILLLVFDTRIADTKAYRIQDMVLMPHDFPLELNKLRDTAVPEPTTLWNPSLGAKRCSQ